MDDEEFKKGALRDFCIKIKSLSELFRISSVGRGETMGGKKTPVTSLSPIIRPDILVFVEQKWRNSFAHCGGIMC